MFFYAFNFAYEPPIVRSLHKKLQWGWICSMTEFERSTFLDCSSNYIVRNRTCSHLPGAKGASNFFGLKILEWTCLYEFGNTNLYVSCDPFCIAKNEGMYKLVSINWSIIWVSHERNVLTDILVKEESSSTNSRWLLLFLNCNQLIY
jgi:hypothetical protein